jgi:hypothetical protein
LYYNYDPNVVRAEIKGEAHVIPNTAPYTLYLNHIPKLDNPSTVTIVGFTETAGVLAQGKFKVAYLKEGKGAITFYSGDAGKAVAINYKVCGTLLWSEGLNSQQELIDQINFTLQDVAQAVTSLKTDIAGLKSLMDREIYVLSTDTKPTMTASYRGILVETDKTSNNTYYWSGTAWVVRS